MNRERECWKMINCQCVSENKKRMGGIKLIMTLPKQANLFEITKHEHVVSIEQSTILFTLVT